MSDPDESDSDLKPWPVGAALKYGHRTSSPTTLNEESPWSGLTVALGVVLLLLTIACCTAITDANAPSSGSGIAPPPSTLVALAILPLLIVAGVLALIVGGRVSVLRPVGLVMVAAIVGTWGFTGISNASKTYTSPEIVGVISAVDVRPDGTLQVRLADGRVLELRDGGGGNGEAGNTSGHYSPLVSYPPPAVGTLLLAGERPNPWYVSTPSPIHSGSSLCYTVSSKGWISGGQVRLAIGLELVNRVGAWIHDGYFDGYACLDGSGAVVEILSFGY